VKIKQHFRRTILEAKSDTGAHLLIKYMVIEVVAET